MYARGWLAWGLPVCQGICSQQLLALGVASGQRARPRVFTCPPPPLAPCRDRSVPDDYCCLPGDELCRDWKLQALVSAAVAPWGAAERGGVRGGAPALGACLRSQCPGAGFPLKSRHHRRSYPKQPRQHALTTSVAVLGWQAVP